MPVSESRRINRIEIYLPGRLSCLPGLTLLFLCLTRCGSRLLPLFAIFFQLFCHIPNLIDARGMIARRFGLVRDVYDFKA